MRLSDLCPTHWFRKLALSRDRICRPKESVPAGCWLCTFLACCLPLCYLCYLSRTIRDHFQQQTTHYCHESILQRFNVREEKLSSSPCSYQPIRMSGEYVSVLLLENSSRKEIIRRIKEDLDKENIQIKEKSEKITRTNKSGLKASWGDLLSSTRFFSASENVSSNLSLNVMSSHETTEVFKNNNNDSCEHHPYSGKCRDVYRKPNSYNIYPYMGPREEKLPSGEKLELIYFTKDCLSDSPPRVPSLFDVVVLLVSSSERRSLTCERLKLYHLEVFRDYWAGFYDLLVVEICQDYDEVVSETLTSCISTCFSSVNHIFMKSSEFDAEFITRSIAQFFAHTELFQCHLNRVDLVGRGEELACSGLCRLRWRPHVRFEDSNWAGRAESRRRWTKVRNVVRVMQ